MGVFYFKDIMTPPQNVSHVSSHPSTTEISWLSNEFSDRSAMLIPICVEGIDADLYMQFDLGAHTSLIYNKTLLGLEEQYPCTIEANIEYFKNFEFKIKKTIVSYDSIKNIHYGRVYKKGQKAIIGSIGTDILEHVNTLIDFENSKISFFQNPPDSLLNTPKEHFEFKGRRVLICAKIEGRDKKLMWDTGSSAYELITSKSNFHKLAIDPYQHSVHKSNQMNRELKIHTSRAHKTIQFGNESIALNQVTYVEGFPWYVHTAFYLSGMQGMIGNNLFRNQILFLDVRNRQFAIL